MKLDLKAHEKEFNIPYSNYRGSYDEWLNQKYTAREYPYAKGKTLLYKEKGATNPPTFHYYSAFDFITCEFLPDGYYALARNECLGEVLGGTRHLTLTGVEIDPYARY